jgi:hypothetical protein
MCQRQSSPNAAVPGGVPPWLAAQTTGRWCCTSSWPTGTDPLSCPTGGTNLLSHWAILQWQPRCTCTFAATQPSNGVGGAAEEASAPAANADRLDWWPGFKRQLMCKAAWPSMVQAAPAAEAATAQCAAAAELRDAMDARSLSPGTTEPAALARVLAASAAHSAVLCARHCTGGRAAGEVHVAARRGAPVATAMLGHAPPKAQGPSQCSAPSRPTATPWPAHGWHLCGAAARLAGTRPSAGGHPVAGLHPPRLPAPPQSR